MKKINATKSSYCFWDKHEFSGEKFLCPISYKPKQMIRKKNEYYINYEISRYQIIPENIHKILDCIIEFDDCFCSKNCCLAWIDDNIHNPKYNQSKQILANIYFEKNEKIMKAPHWRLLKNFGGFMSIEEFRKQEEIFIEKDIYLDENNCVEKIYEKMKTCV